MDAATESSLIPLASPDALGLDPAKLDRACEIVMSHIAGGFHPGAQLAVARHGKLALYRVFGSATVDPSRPVDEATLFPLFSNTKVVTAAAVWTLVEEGKLRFSDRVAEHVPGFDARFASSNSNGRRRPARSTIGWLPIGSLPC
jgi:CubicO group peptidase (beta-lactamase class C family)